MAINYSSPGVPGGEVSPGAGSTGFTAGAVGFANSSGQLTGSSNLNYESTGSVNTLRMFSTVLAGLEFSTGSTVAGSMARILYASTASVGAADAAAKDLIIRAQQTGRVIFTNGTTVNAILTSAGNLQIGRSSVATERLSLPSTVNASTGIGAAGAAAALPATPEVYFKVLGPNGTTLYIPAYLST